MSANEDWGYLFKKIAKSKGLIPLKPNYNQFKTFTNLLLEGKNKKISKICLKSLKENGKDNSWVWVELKNSEGKPGWLFGSSDFIVFEMKTEFIFIDRLKLIDFVFKNVSMDKPFCKNWWEAKNKICQRKGKQDQITLLKIFDLKKINNTNVWNK